ncbi:MAG: hypothetical protein ACFE9Q_12035 [Candidatus Hodarchaeota archaeon]
MHNITIKIGIIAGIFALLLAFIAKIPIYPPENLVLSFNIFTIDNLEYFFWGYLVNGTTAYTAVGGSISEVIISTSIWLMIFYIGLSSIFASTNKAKLHNSIKLFKINILLLSIILLIFGIIIFFILLVDFALFLYVIGFGYYFIIIILILNVTSLKILKQDSVFLN